MSEADELKERIRDLVEALQAAGVEGWASSFQRAADLLPGDLHGAAWSVIGNFGGAGSFSEWEWADIPFPEHIGRVNELAEVAYKYSRLIFDRGRGGAEPFSWPPGQMKTNQE